MDTQFQLTAEPCTQEIVITCVIEAQYDLVFNAFLDPTLIPRWWGPKYLTTVVDQLDARPGGMWRYVQQDQNGNEYAFHGVFHAITSLESIVQTFEFEGAPGHVLLETILFENLYGKTRITDQSIFQSVADRDGMLAENMQAGSSESMDSLAELLSSMKEE